MRRNADHHSLAMGLSPTLHHPVSVEPFSSLWILEESEVQYSSKGCSGCCDGRGSDGPW